MTAGVEALIAQAEAAFKAGRPDAALPLLDQAVAAAPASADAHTQRGRALLELGQADAALQCQQQALALQPDHVDAHNRLGMALRRLGRPTEALAAFERSLALRPDLFWVHSNRGNALGELGRIGEAMAAHVRALELHPGFAEAHYNLSLLQLLTGDFAGGWPRHEWRWQNPAFGFGEAPFVEPPWLGRQPIAGLTILLHAEQGLGDTLQFMRYAPRVRALGARTVLMVQPALKTLLAGWPGADAVLSHDDPLPAGLQAHCPLMSLPLAFGTTAGTMPSDAAYLAADPARVAAWRHRFGADGPRVGVVWAGNRWHRNDHNRSLPLAVLLTALGDGGRFVSLQKDPTEADRALLHRQGVVDASPHLHDLADTAALIDTLDLVLTVDTAVAHLAGAMGRPVWLLLPWVPDWRWLLNRDDSPWYPSMRLYRQPGAGDWAGVLQRVADDLRNRAPAA